MGALFDASVAKKVGGVEPNRQCQGQRLRSVLLPKSMALTAVADLPSHVLLLEGDVPRGSRGESTSGRYPIRVTAAAYICIVHAIRTNTGFTLDSVRGLSTAPLARERESMQIPTEPLHKNVDRLLLLLLFSGPTRRQATPRQSAVLW